ncbi:protein containg helix-turn-helix domain [Longilinea arvoryzae]|uniref:Protein containg helix-turn-helix domain n=1 Tax=Longilinea arvoryzae TaxID=360412 RepID=A0A0S7BD90_9CHLR|nr:helix-turn-helix domain-containing protein [Longilinea arvoryzae]GAP13273.1 protein containg helix-turn-helix domain [Longilinea arvoryzae]
MPDYLSVKEAAEKLDISPAAVRSLIQKGELEGAFQSPSRAWLIPAEAVSAYKSGHREPSRKPRKTTSRPHRETTKKDEKKRPAKKKKETRKRKASQSSGIGLDDVVQALTQILGKSNKPQSGSLLTTLLEQFTGQKRSVGPDQLNALLANLGEQDPDLLQEVLKSLSAPDLAGLPENLKPRSE